MKFGFFTASRGQASGFTLIELLVTLAVAAVMVGIALPSFMSTMESSRERSVIDAITTSIKYARSEAVKRNRQLALCSRDASSTGCSGTTAWAQSGWLLLSDNPDPTPDEVLRVWDPLQGQTIITAPVQMVFNADGTLESASALTVKSGGRDARNFCVNLTGSIYEGACP